MKNKSLLVWLLALVCAFCAFSCRRSKPKPNVVLIVIDTARKDHFSCYGYERKVTPKIDDFAAESVRFDNAQAASPWTLPSMASILTGLYPHKHLAGYAAKDEKTKQEGMTYLNKSAITLTELLFQNNYQTVGWFQNPFVDPGFGLNRGFEIYDYFPGDNLRIRSADQVIDSAMKWLGETRDKKKPFFMVLHFFDPHLAYNPPGDFMMSFIYTYKGKMRPPFNPSNEEIDKMQKGQLTPSPEDQQFIVGLYNGELAFVDFTIGRFFDFLKLNKLYDRSLIIITADHGEEFWEHNGFEHGHSMYQELLNVPLIIRFPDAENKGMAVKTTVSLTDLAPSIISYLGLESPGQTGGKSFISMPGAAVKPIPRPIIAELNRVGDPLQAIYRDQYKLILNSTTGKIEIFNLQDDPKEKNNLFGQKEKYPAEIVDQIKGVAAMIKKLEAANKLIPAQIDPDTIKKLKALNY